MLLPARSRPAGEGTAAEVWKEEESQELALEELLSRLEGAGKTRVLLTQASGPEHYYQTDEDSQQAADAIDRRRETVIITGADRSQQGLIRRTDPPVYLGAVVLCQGADRPAVKLAVVEAVATATGLRSDKISVLKME